MKNILLFVITSFVSLNIAFCQDLLSSYSTGSNSITPARMKYFENHVYIAANITINNQTFPSIIKLDNNGNIIWQTRLDQPGIVSDLEFVPQSGISDKAILLVGESESSLMNLDNKSFIWKVKDDGTHLTSKFYNHTGNEGFIRIKLHPNPINLNYKYYITGKRNLVFPTTTTNPSNSYKTLLYNIDENLNVNWAKNFDVTVGVPAGNEAQFYNSIVPLPNGELYLLGSTFNLNTLEIHSGVRMTVNVNNTTVTGTGYKDLLRHEIKDGFFSNGEFHSSGYLVNTSFQKYGDMNRLWYSGKTMTNLSSFNGIVGIGTDLFTICEKIGNPNPGKVIINKFQYTTTPFYNLNYLTSVSVTPSGVSAPFVNSQLCADATNNILFSSSSNGSLYFGKINSTLNSPTATSCYLPQTFSAANTTNDGGSYQWRFLVETNSVTTLGQGISFNLTKTSICSPPAPCVLTVGFTQTPGNCGATTFTPTVSGGTAPYTYAWDIGCNGSIEFTTQNPTYTYTFPTSGTYDICLTVTDASEACMGSQAMSITVIKDNIAPVITCPAGNISLNTNLEFCSASYGGVSATDNCGIVANITCVLTGATTGTFSNVSQIQYNKGLTMVSCTATDDSGNVSAPCTFTVTVFDSAPPQIVCPGNVSVSAMQCDNSAVATFLPPTVYDNCPMTTYSCNYMSGDAFPCGNTIVTCIATDMGGANTSCSFSVNVGCSNSCPAVTGSNLSCGTSPNTFNYTVILTNPNPATNVCTYTLSLPPAQGTINSTNITAGNPTTISGSLTPANNSISTFNLSIVASCTCNGNQQQTCNLAATLQNIEIIPSPPQIICPPSITINTIEDQCYSFYEDVSATDYCDPNPSVTCTLSGATTGVFTNVSAIQYNVGVTLVECVATDLDGATSQCSFTVTVLDNQLPTIICPAHVSIQVQDCSNSAVVAFPAPVVTDNCPMVQYTCSHQTNDIFNCGNTVVTCTATDMAGNTATCNFEVAVACACVDVVSSVINCDQATHTYLFSIHIMNNSGTGSTCTSSVSLDPSQGVILNQTTTWSGNMGTITGAIQPTLVAPFTFNLSVFSECTCANGLNQNCTSNIPYPITEVCTNFIIFDKVYGDAQENIASGIKAFGNGIYVTSQKLIGTEYHGTVSKFNIATGALMWQILLDKNSDIADFEYIPDDPGTPLIFDDRLLLVGNTSIGFPWPAPIGEDFSSFILKLDCSTGGIVAYNEYNQSGREKFERIVKHPFPADPLFPYYILGRVNAGLPSTLDRVLLYNLNQNLGISWIQRYSSTTMPTSTTDDEFSRGLICLANGDLLLLGNETTVNDGVFVYVSGVSGLPVPSIRMGGAGKKFDIYDGIQLADGSLIFVGERFDTKNAFIMHWRLQSGTYIPQYATDITNIQRFKDVWIDSNNKLYAIGQYKNSNDYNVVFKFSIGPNGILTEDAFYLEDGIVTDYTEGKIYVTPDIDRIYYVDSRKSVPNPFGEFNLLVGAFDLSLSSDCTYPFIPTRIPLTYTTSPISASPTALGNPSVSHLLNSSPLYYQCADFCGPNCNVNALFEAVPVNCFEMQFNDLSSGGTTPYTYVWDFDCTSPAESTSQNPTWTFPGSGTYTVCLTVTDATGLCSSSTMQTVIVPPDTTDPNLMCPPDITLNTDINQCYATYGGVSATDNCDASPDIVCTLSGATIGTFTNQSPLQYNKGVTMVSCTATDDSGNFKKCTFKVTVKDNQMPTIFCPPNKVVSAPFCDGGANVTFDPPLISDNCPMASYTCTHASGDFFPCGTTVVMCTVTDMFGNTNSCTFNITVNCTCTQITEAEITCGTLPDTYDFVITVENLSGNGTSCNLSFILDPTQGAITNQVIIPMGNMSEISGTITPSGTIPDFFNFTVLSECICPNGTKISCTLPFALESICCKSAFLTDDEMCKEAASHTITLGFNGSVTSITQVNWYISFSNPCPTDRMDPSWQLYASVNQNSASVDVYPPYLAGDFCMYAVVSVTDNPCTELTSDIAHFILCDFVECTLPSQEYCYTGTPVAPAPILLNAGNAHCNFEIEWLDQNGNPIPGSTNQSSYQPPTIIWTAPLTDCKQVFNYSAEVTGPCGPEVCSATITLYNESAPTGTIEIDPFEVIPLCQGEDLTLHFEPICPEEPLPITWKWLRGNTFSTLGHAPQLGDMNPVINTNAVYQDIWYGVEIQNGVCPPVKTAIFIDIINPLKILNFSANHIAPCRNNGVHLEMTYGSDVCPVTVKWYKDGILINTMINVTGGFVSYNFYNAGLNGNYSGNYYAIIESTCCPDQIRKSNVIQLAKPFILLLSGPCFRCNDDLVLLEATVLNTNGVNCSFQWYEFVGSSFVPMAGETTPSLVLERAGHFKVIVQCGTCGLEQDFIFPQCGTTGTNDIFTNQIDIFPNPTTGQLTIQFASPPEEDITLKVFNLLGKEVSKQIIYNGSIIHFFTIEEMAAIYIVQLSDTQGNTFQKKVIKIE